jgi:hypothetical protein
MRKERPQLYIMADDQDRLREKARKAAKDQVGFDVRYL